LFLKNSWKFIDSSPFTDGWPIEAIAEHLQAVVDGDIRKLLINIPPRMGKQIADETPVLTTNGWKTHGELVVGDYVYSPDGTPIEVLAVTGKTPSNVRVEFFDGSVIYCHENHEWTLYNREIQKEETLETGKFFRSKNGRWGKTKGKIKQVVSGGRAIYQLPLTSSLTNEEKHFPVDPYALGAWLGDGTAGKPCISHSSSDYAYIEKIASNGYAISKQWLHNKTGVVTTSFAYSGLRDGLTALGVYRSKHIPDTYFTGSESQRLNLLAGLIDTDGTVSKTGRCHITTVSEELANDIAKLVRTFGWRASTSRVQPRTSTSGIVGKKFCYVISFQPTFAIPVALERKKIRRFAKQRRIGLKSVTYDPCGKVGHCIEVDADDGLYLVGEGLIPTHNSSITSVAFPAWVWAQPWASPTSGPGVQLLHASYAHSLALRDSVKCRRLIESPWYQERWGERFKLSGDQNTKGRFANDKNGERLITAVEARVTGEGGDIIVIDDPNAANEAFSEASIYTTTEWWDGTMSTRLNDPKTGAFIVIQQRLSEQDLTGYILSKEDADWVHLCLPMRYEWQRHTVTVLGWEDPRGLDDEDKPLVLVADDGERIARDPEAAGELVRREGMLLWPERISEKEVIALEKDLGPYKAAGQLQQRPAPKGGGIIKDDWWQLWPESQYPNMSYVVASLDTAYTTKTENDPSAMTVWGIFTGDLANYATNFAGKDGRLMSKQDLADRFDDGIRIKTMQEMTGDSFPKVMMMYAWQDRLELHELTQKVAKTCRDLDVNVLLIENKAAGISVAQELKRLFWNENFMVQLVDPKGQDKTARLHSVVPIFAENMIYAPNRKWAEMVIRQVGEFPKGKHDDLVDTVSMAIKHLREIGLLTRSIEWAAEAEYGLRHRGSDLPPLYEV
jgi:predicted phage terminase large subunit-like protein